MLHSLDQSLERARSRIIDMRRLPPLSFEISAIKLNKRPRVS